MKNRFASFTNIIWSAGCTHKKSIFKEKVSLPKGSVSLLKGNLEQNSAK